MCIRDSITCVSLWPWSCFQSRKSTFLRSFCSWCLSFLTILLIGLLAKCYSSSSSLTMLMPIRWDEHQIPCINWSKIFRTLRMSWSWGTLSLYNDIRLCLEVGLSLPWHVVYEMTGFCTGNSVLVVWAAITFSDLDDIWMCDSMICVMTYQYKVICNWSLYTSEARGRCEVD